MAPLLPRNVNQFIKLGGFISIFVLVIYLLIENLAYAEPDKINTWLECPPQSNTIWVKLDAQHSPTGAENVIEIPFDTSTAQIDGYEYDNYIRGVLAGEVSTANEPDGTVIEFGDETLEAMAIAVRTKAYHLCGNAAYNNVFYDSSGVKRHGIRGQVIQNCQLPNAEAVGLVPNKER